MKYNPAQGHSPTYEQTHVGFDLGTMALYILWNREREQ